MQLSYNTHIKLSYVLDQRSTMKTFLEKNLASLLRHGPRTTLLLVLHEYTYLMDIWSQYLYCKTWKRTVHSDKEKAWLQSSNKNIHFFSTCMQEVYCQLQTTNTLQYGVSATSSKRRILTHWPRPSFADLLPYDTCLHTDLLHLLTFAYTLT